MTDRVIKRHLLVSLLSLAIMLALIPSVLGASKVYAQKDSDFGKICFDGDRDYEWSHFYNVENKDATLSLDDLNITVLNKAGEEIDPSEYDLSIIHIYYDRQQDKDIEEPVEPPLGIQDTDKENGFSEYRAIATAKEGSSVSSRVEGDFIIMDKYSLNYVCPDIRFENYAEKDDWRMRDRYRYAPGADIVASVRDCTSAVLNPGTDYDITYYYRSGSPEDMDDPSVRFEDILVADDDHKVNGIPSEPGGYFASIQGKGDYYGGNDVLIDIDSTSRIVFRGDEHELWSDADLTFKVECPDGIDGKFWLGVGARGENGWDVLFNNEQNPEEFFEYDNQSGELTLHGDAIFEAIGDRDVNIYANITKEDDEDVLLAEGFADVHAREAKNEYDLPKDDNLLPGWDGWINESFRVYIENKQYPEGKDWDLTVTDVTLKNVDPAGAITLEARDGGWEYRAETYGSATITLEYKDIDGTAKEHSFEVVASDHVYCADFWPVEGINQGLPGTSIELQADAEHNFIRYDEEDHNNWWHDSTREGLVYHWNIVRGDEFATITQDAKDPSKATLTFKNLSGGQKDIGEQIIVKLSITDAESNDADKERAANEEDFWVNSDYMQIMPAQIDSNLDVGRSLTIEPELWHYQYGKDGHEVIEADFEIENVDDNAIDVAKTNNGFKITRKGDWDTNFNIRARFKWGDGREDDTDQWYHLDRKEYRIGFPYDDIEIYSDQDLTIELEKENLEGLDKDEYRIDYKVGTWDNSEKRWTYEMDPSKYTADSNGITLTGAEIMDAGVDGVNVRAELFINGQEDPKCDTWVWVNLNRRPCKEDEHRWQKATIKQATCYEKGKEIWCCLSHQLWHGCGEVRIVETDPLNHKDHIVEVAAKDSTLTATGNKEHYRCTLCGDLFSDAAGAKQITPESVVIAKKINISGATVAAIPNKTYNKTAQKPALTVKYGSTALKADTDYTVAYSNNTNVGTAKVTITGKGKYAGTNNVTFKIVKAANPVKVTAKTATVKYAALSKKNQVVKQTAVCTVSGAQGALTYHKASVIYTKDKSVKMSKKALKKYTKKAAKKITINAKTGKVTVKKGLKKGTYKVKVKVKAAGNANYDPSAWKTVTFKIKIK